MQEEEDANQKVQQQILRRRQIDEELRQAIEKLRECFSKGDNCVASLQDVAQEEEYEDEQLEHFGEKNQETRNCAKNQETRNEKLKNVNVNSETQAESVEEEIQEPKEEQESMEQREIEDFQEPEILEEGRNILSEEIKTIEKLEVFGVPEYLQDPEDNAHVASDSQMESVEEELQEQKKIKTIHRPLRLETLEGVDDQTVASFDEVGSEIRVKISTEVQLKTFGNQRRVDFVTKGAIEDLLEHNVGIFFPKREIPYDAAKVFDKKLKIKLITRVFFFWNGRWSFDPGVKSFFLRCGCWIFNPGKTYFYPEDRNPSWNQELTWWRGMKQKIAILILSSCVFQYLTENGVIFVMWKHRWRWKIFTFDSTTGFTISCTG
jgi:hypothetical protein